jgi:hypothetical protein
LSRLYTVLFIICTEKEKERRKKKERKKRRMKASSLGVLEDDNLNSTTN